MRSPITLIIALFCSVCVFACGIPEVHPKAGHIVPKRFVNETGWKIPELAGIRPKVYTDTFGATELVYEGKSGNLGKLELQGFVIDPDKNTLTFYPGHEQRVQQVRQFKAGSRTFAFELDTFTYAEVDPPLTVKVPAKKPGRSLSGVYGCGYTKILIFDSDGDGVFESLEYLDFASNLSNAVDHRTIPEWALDLLPNKSEVERYRNGNYRLESSG